MVRPAGPAGCYVAFRRAGSWDRDVEQALRQHLQQLLAADESGARGTRLLDDAQRLWQRSRRLLALNLIPPDIDRNPLELACYALQLPMRQAKPATGRLGQTSLKERAE